MRTRFALEDSVALDDGCGTIVAGQVASGGQFTFEVGGGAISGSVLKATGPQVALDNVQVWLVQEIGPGGAAERYAVLVEDPYWGVRVQPARFEEAPFSETLVMGYRLRGRVMDGETPVVGANVSLELSLTTLEDGDVVLWDSEEYNELVYSEELETWIQGPTVLAPLQTDQEGCWRRLSPMGTGRSTSGSRIAGTKVLGPEACPWRDGCRESGRCTEGSRWRSRRVRSR